MITYDWTDPNTGDQYFIRHNSDNSGMSTINVPAFTPEYGRAEVYLPAKLLADFSRSQTINECIRTLEQME